MSILPEKQNVTSAPSNTSNSLQTFDLEGSAGRLEAILNEPSAAKGSPGHAVLVCHPHPLGGGTMHNKVVYRAMKVFQEHGFPVLRFNFRGVGRSEGQHDHGEGEQQDVRTAMDWLSAKYDLPLIVAGFSFGAAMSFAVCCGDSRVDAIVGLGLPLSAAGRLYEYDRLTTCPQPKLFISSDKDEFAPYEQLEAVFQSAAPPSEYAFVEGGDHFFAGRLELMQQHLRDWLVRRFPT